MGWFDPCDDDMWYDAGGSVPNDVHAHVDFAARTADPTESTVQTLLANADNAGAASMQAYARSEEIPDASTLSRILSLLVAEEEYKAAAVVQNLLGASANRAR